MKGHNTLTGLIGAFSENGPQITLGLPGAAGGKITFWGRASHIYKNNHLQKNTSTLPYSGYLSLLFTAVFSLRSTTFGVFRTRRTGGWGDAVEAGRHPPADGRTPETATQWAVAAVLPLLEPLHNGGTTRSPKLPEEEINCYLSLFQEHSNKHKGQCESVKY